MSDWIDEAVDDISLYESKKPGVFTTIGQIEKDKEEHIAIIRKHAPDIAKYDALKEAVREAMKDAYPNTWITSFGQEERESDESMCINGDNWDNLKTALDGLEE